MKLKRSTYYLAESYGSNQHTASIVRKDNENILASMGFTEIKFRHTKAGSAIVKWRRTVELGKLFFSIKKESMVVFHFPMLAKAHLALFNMLQRKGVQTIALIIDIDGLRYNDTSLLQSEIEYLQKFTYVIAHNTAMKEFLSAQISREKIYCIGLFDYPAKKEERARELSHTVCFAGNFEKASFVYELYKIRDASFNLYGNTFTGSDKENVIYKGLYAPAALPQHLEGSFGLVWDGASTENCDEYLQYNNPHKFSLYIAAAMPVIVWDKSALASFVTEKQAGFSISTLAEIPERIRSISAADYATMKKNISLLRQDVINGSYLKKAITRCMG